MISDTTHTPTHVFHHTQTAGDPVDGVPLSGEGTCGQLQLTDPLGDGVEQTVQTGQLTQLLLTHTRYTGHTCQGTVWGAALSTTL